MMKIIKTSLMAVVLVATAHTAMADRGIGKKVKNKVSLNISTSYNNTLKNSLYYNLRNGLTYRGSILVKKQFSTTSTYNNTLVTFQKGNTIYVIPYKNKVVMPEIKQGYTGIKIRIPVH